MVTSELPLKLLVQEMNILHYHQKPVPSTVISSVIEGEVIILITQLGFSMPFLIVRCTEIKIKQPGRKLIHAFYC